MRLAAALVVLAGLTISTHGQEIASSELKFNAGQSVQPAYEGWTRNSDGSRSMWFGYLNRNWEETPDIPAGANNGFGAGSEDLGQPTHFLPRRQAFVFKVNVPADWPGGDPHAIHATQDLGSIGQAASLGCLRSHPARVRWLIETIPLGAPVFIRS